LCDLCGFRNSVCKNALRRKVRLVTFEFKINKTTIMKKILLLFLVTVSVNFSKAQSWAQKANFTGAAREAGAMCIIGNKLYSGLGGSTTYYKDLYEYDISTNTWSAKANFPGVIRFAPACFALNGKVYVGGGFNISFVPLSDFYCYNPSTNTWTQVASFGGGARAAMFNFALNGFGYCGTGVNSTYYTVKDMWKYNDTTNSWTQVANFPGGNRWRAAACVMGNFALVTCGADSLTYNDVWKYDPVSNTWTQKANFPGLPRQSPFAITVLGMTYVGTGSSMNGADYNDIYKYDPGMDTWTPVPNFPGGARNSSVFASNGIKGFVGLGNTASGWKNDLWEFSTSSSTSVTEIAPALSFQAFPNPAINYLKISGTPDKLENSEIEIFNIMGEVVQKNIYSGDIDISGLAPGTYIMKVTLPGQTACSKFIKE